MVLINSCEKDDLTETQKNRFKIVGDWVWVKSYGGFTGHDLYTPGNTGITKEIAFFINGDVIIKENDIMVDKTDYFLSNEKSYLFNEKAEFLTINYKYRISDPDSIITLPMRYIIEDLSNSMFLAEDVYDGYGHEYMRKNN